MAENRFESYYKTPIAKFPWYARAIRVFIFTILRIFCSVFWRAELINQEKIKLTKEGKGQVIAMNHMSMADPLLVVGLFPLSTHVRPLYKSEINFNIIISFLMACSGGIPLKRGSADIKTLRNAKNAITRGEHVLIYPEGTRIRPKQAVPPQIFGGFALIARMAKTKILPAGVSGTDRITPPGKHFIRPVKCQIAFGDSINFDKYNNLEKKEALEKIEKDTMQEVYNLRNTYDLYPLTEE